MRPSRTNPSEAARRLAPRSGRRTALLVAAALCALGMKPRDAPEYGSVLLDRRASRAGVPPVTFDHWRHRARFSCRVCHVDVGFAMARGETGISAATNRARFHCGACHDGSPRAVGRPTFAACSTSRNVDEAPACRRCHARPDETRARKAFEEFAARFPRGTFRDVDWERAEAQGLVAPADFLEGVSVARPALKMDRDVQIESKATWMTDVLFSHRKHAAWNGCEVCHPDIFPPVERDAASPTMLQIAGGESCGACHDRVAFPLAYCERCHLKRVR